MSPVARHTARILLISLLAGPAYASAQVAVAPPPPSPDRLAPVRQSEPARQAEPPRQAEPRHQAGPGRQPAARPDTHWPDNGRSQSPFLRHLDPAVPTVTPRPGPERPGQDLFRAGPDTYAPRAPRPSRPSGGVYFGYPYLPTAGFAPYVPSAVSPAGVADAGGSRGANAAEGFLRLQVRPRATEVFVDGAFAGTVDDFGGAGERALGAGTHRIELHATGFARVTFDVRVPANDTVTFRRDLEPLDAVAPATPAVPPADLPHKTIYIIPRCYAGDTPPQADQLPPRCSVADLRTIP